MVDEKTEKNASANLKVLGIGNGGGASGVSNTGNTNKIIKADIREPLITPPENFFLRVG